jgi:SAM-dependent methyltransferase
VQIARDRLAPYADRARVRRTDGAFAYDRTAASQDRVLATYVLDLLAPADVRALLAEAHRLLRPDGRLCVAGLTWGTRPLGRLVTALWAWIHRCRPTWVGGCRPLRARRFLDPSRWHVEHHAVVRAWGVPSEVIVAAPA